MCKVMLLGHSHASYANLKSPEALSEKLRKEKKNYNRKSSLTHVAHLS